MSNKIVLAFDIYGTILDPSSMQAHLADFFPDSAATLTSLWRRYQLEYTWRATCQETYEPFETITKKALVHALIECGEEVDKQSIKDIMEHYETLNIFPDVEKTLQKLKAEGKFDLCMFSNGSHFTLDSARATHKVLTSVFPPDKVLSVHDVKSYKPSRTSYTHLLKSVGKLDKPEDVFVVSSNPFDICGSGTMGMRSVWVNRGDTQWADQLGPKPTKVIHDFAELVKLEH